MRRLLAKRLLGIALALLLIAALTACGGKAPKEVKLDEVMAKFELGDEMMAMDADDLVNVYYFDAADLKQCAAAVHSSGVDCDEIILIEAVDSAAAGRVKEILDARYEAKLNETENYLPEEHAIVEKCSVTQDGNFVAMIVSPDAEKLTAIYEESLR